MKRRRSPDRYRKVRRAVAKVAAHVRRYRMKGLPAKQMLQRARAEAQNA